MYRYVFISSIVFPSMQWQSPSVRDACRHNMHLLVLVVFFLCLNHAPRVDKALTQHPTLDLNRVWPGASAPA